jgi:hypothetical protein
LDFLANAGEPGNWYGIATDKAGAPYIQGPKDPFPGFYVSTTALIANPKLPIWDPNRYVNSETVPYIVAPRGLTTPSGRRLLGLKCKCEYQGKEQEGIVADIGPAKKIGEISIAMADALGINSNARNGGVFSGVKYTIFV